MHTTLNPDIADVIQAAHYRPAISIFMPFEPKMNSSSSLAHNLKIAVTKVCQQLEESYSHDVSKVMEAKLSKMVSNLNYATHKKSIAIFVSPVFEKVIYLDIPIEEKIMIDNSFEIRDLVYCAKQSHKFLVLILSNRSSTMYLADSNNMTKILSQVHHITHEPAARVSNFTDPSAMKEAEMHKFLREIDNSLNIIISSYKLPLFIMGTERIAGHFKAMSNHTRAVVEYVHGNYEDTSIPELQRILEPYVSDWRNVHEKDVRNKLDDAASRNRLVFGIRNVWKELREHTAKLLVVEKNYMYPASDDNPAALELVTGPYNRYSYIKDVVDEIIEKVIEAGGDVEFVEEGFLKEMGHIALVKYY